MKLNEKRVKSLEQAASIGKVHVNFFEWHGSEVTGAKGPRAPWQREPGETLDDFQDRIRRDIGQFGNGPQFVWLFGEPGPGTFSDGDIL